MQNRFELLPDELLLYICGSIHANDLMALALVNKKWYGIIDELIYKPDIITSLCEHLSQPVLKNKIIAYRQTAAWRLLSAITPHERTAWQELICQLLEADSSRYDLLAPAFLSVAKQLTPHQLGPFITNFRTTRACQRFLSLTNPNHLQCLCHALLCDNVKQINPDRLSHALHWAENEFSDNNSKLLLKGINVSLAVRLGAKQLPNQPTYYINLRGANLENADLTQSDFSLGYIDLSHANLKDAAFSHTKMIYKWYAPLLLLPAAWMPAKIMVRLISLFLAGKWYIEQSPFKDESNLSGLDLRHTSSIGTQFDGCMMDKTLLTHTSFTAYSLCGAMAEDAILLEEVDLATIDVKLNNLMALSAIPQIKRAIANNLISIANDAPKEVAINLLKAAVTHPFFTQDRSYFQKGMTYLETYGLGGYKNYGYFFHLPRDNSLESLKKAYYELLQRVNEPYKKEVGLKRKFSAI